MSALFASRRRALRLIAAAAAGAMLPLAGCGRPDAFPPRVGSSFPSFDLPDLDGRMHRLADHAGSPLLINFWATWCPPCRAEMPDLQALHLRLAARGLRVLGISVDDAADPVREFLLKNPVAFPILLDSRRALAGALRLEGYPTSFLIGRDGVIVETISGVRPWGDAEYAGSIARRLALE
ncbi:MAG: hypothetical protein A2Z95_01295 [Gallionellales bacterium GWA2_60_18]|nr:MAG: hypothetical protein A2Z95_01295 [Gallionellales bacterium GWA2_60_18]